MKKVKSIWVMALVSLAVLALNVPGHTAEIIYEEDIVQNIVNKDVLVRVVDNVIVLMDASSSMADMMSKYNKTGYEMEKTALSQGSNRLPDLGYTVGFYLFSPSWQEIYPMQKFDRAKIAEAMKKLPAKASGKTPLVGGLEKLEGVLKGLQGKTAVYLFSDGGWERGVLEKERERVPTKKQPGTVAAELARKYNVCFYVISYAADDDGRTQVTNMAKANACSRVIPFDAYITNPHYASGLLYYVKAGTSVETTSKMKAKGIVVGNIYFDHDKFELKGKEKEDVDQLGKFLKDNPKAFVVLQGFTDSQGTQEYNMDLSRRRTETVASYLMKNFKVDAGRVVASWYGEANPIATNGTEEGRAKNRRVEVAVGGM
jgi:OmpA-OmpF porin, OOP family